MGAHSFLDTTDLTDPTEGFRDLQIRALSEYGNDSYNGTISTVAGFSQAARYRDPIPHDCLWVLENRIWDERREGDVPEIRKWESCLAVPLADREDFEWEERSFTFDVESGGRNIVQSWEAQKKVIEQLGPEEWAADVKIEKLTPDREVRIEEKESEPGQLIGFAVATVSAGGPSIDSRNLYEDREAALDRARRMSAFDERKHTVIEIRSAGFTCGQARSLDLYRVTYRVPRALSNPQVSGWAFIGMAAS